MKRFWTRIAARVDGMSLRERSFIFAALAVLVIAVANTLLLDPEWEKQKLYSRQLAQRQGEIAAFQNQLQKLAAGRLASPDRANRDELERLRRDIAATEARIADEQRRFTRPEQMRAVLEEMLGRNRNISLLDMKTQPPALLAGASKPAAKAGAQGVERQIYKHGIELTVAGSYFDLLAYVAALERLPTRLYWGGVAMETGDYPLLRIKLTVFTLSLDKTWMNV